MYVGGCVVLLGPFDLQDEMIVAVVVDTPDGTLGVFFVGERHERKSTRHLFRLVFGQERAHNFAERLEQLLQIRLGRLLGQIAHTNSIIVFK